MGTTPADSRNTLMFRKRHTVFKETFYKLLLCIKEEVFLHCKNCTFQLLNYCDQQTHLSRHNVFLRCDLFLTTHVCAHRETSLVSSLNSNKCYLSP